MLAIGTHIVDLKKPTLMGVLNVTPDSFSDGGAFFQPEKAIEHAFKMIEEGADIIDVGGESSRPGANPIPLHEELQRVIPVISAIRGQTNVAISIDTTKSEVARRALDAGADMINDISAGRFDPFIFQVASQARVPICLMHMKGTPKTMQNNCEYEDIMCEIQTFLADACRRAERAGISLEKIVIDPGIGFGKTAEDNLAIIKNLPHLKTLNKTILIGTSRKSFIGKLLNLTLDKRLEATLATLSIAYKNGASIFRVHDVAPAKRYLSMMELLA
jgi:dihydropteroate synthase